MTSNRGKYVMSPELAMKREMAYRQRLELLQLIGNSSESGKLPAPSNQTSLPASRPTADTGLSQSQNMRPKLSEHTTPNPSPSSNPWPRGPRLKTMPSPNPLPPRPRGPTLHQRPGGFSSQAGPRTKSVITGPRGPRPYVPQSPTSSLSQPRPSPVVQSTGQRPSLLPTPSVRQRLGPTLGSSIHKRKEAPTQLQPSEHGGKTRKLSCEVCEVHCSSPANLQMHLMGQKHKAQLKKGKQVQTKEDDPKLYCNLCEIWCMNEFSFKQHLSGKNHILKLHSTETKK
ncbi:Zinc finger RNA-binding protein 2 [Bienertia sinuspersici]